MTYSLFALLLALLPPVSSAGTRGGAEALRLLISVEQQSITAPFPARITLHLHNAAPEALWLYRRVRGDTKEGSSLAVHLAPVGLSSSTQISSPARGVVFESVGLPRPRLVRLGAGDDHEEKATIRLLPALAATDGAAKPLWGRYRLSVTYRAKYSNVEQIARNVQVSPWQGEVSSNALEVGLLPPNGTGAVAGTVMDSDGRPLPRARVSLTDQRERLVDQLVTDPSGRFSFTDLPLGLYWVTARREDESVDTTNFRHITLTAEAPAGSIEIFLLPRPTYEAQQILHKPVLFRITDGAGLPASKVTLESVWSIGTVIDTVKGQTYEDGTATLELIPGRSFLTLKKRDCPNQEYRLDVDEDDGIEGFRLTLECGSR